MPFWQFFRKGRDGRALIVRPLRIPHRNSKIIFALGADEFLVMLEGKIRETPFLKVQSGKITVCVGQPIILLLGTLSYLIQISQSFVLMAFVAYETQGLAGHFRTLINQLLSWFYFLVSKMEK